jgi:hypothetical protein
MLASAVGAASTYIRVLRNVEAREKATPCERICVGKISPGELLSWSSSFLGGGVFLSLLQYTYPTTSIPPP